MIRLNSRFKRTVSLIINALLVIFTIWAFRDEDMRCLRYFTNLSNVLCGITSLLIIIFTLKDKEGKGIKAGWACVLRFIAAAMMALTLITVVVFLAPSVVLRGGSYFVFFRGNLFFLHFLDCVLIIIAFAFFDDLRPEPALNVLWGVLPAAVYGLLYGVEVVLLKNWPDFYGFTFGGRLWISPISYIVMCLAMFLISRLLLKLKK